MESLNTPIEKLNALEQKLMGLVELIKQLKEEKAKLEEEKNELLIRLEQLENSVLKGSQAVEELNQESVLTKMVVDDLIKSIDSLVDPSTEKTHAEKIKSPAESEQQPQ